MIDCLPKSLTLVLSTIVGSILALTGATTTRIFQILLIVMVLDILTGILKGIVNKNLRSVLMTIGIAKKGVTMLAIIFAFTMDMLIVPGELMFTNMSVLLAIGAESVSILENIERSGVPMPVAIRKRVHSMADPESYNYNDDLADKIDHLSDLNKRL